MHFCACQRHEEILICENCIIVTFNCTKVTCVVPRAVRLLYVKRNESKMRKRHAIGW